MKRNATILAMCVLSAASCFAQKAMDVISVDDIFRTITHRYITLDNEAQDAQEVIGFYTPIFTSYGYTHELLGDGYGGPCSIIDGFYKDGHEDPETLEFIPDDVAMASMVIITACNGGDDSDYGYPMVSLQVYSDVLAESVLDDALAAGFVKFEYDNPEAVLDGSLLYYNGDKVVQYIPMEGGGAIFHFSMAQ